MEIRLLKYFVAVAEELHFSRAAVRLHIAQPPLSQQIRKLEEELGVQLLSRSKRRVELTEPGRVFLASARSILAQTESAIAEVRRASRGEVGRLPVALVGSATYEDAIPEILRVFRERYPDVAITLHELSTGEQLKALRDGHIQVGFLRPPVHDVGLALDTVFHEPLIAALPVTHQQANEQCVPIAALANDPFIMVPHAQGLGLYELVVSACLQAGFTPQISQEAGELQTVIGLVAAGFGVSLLPAAARKLHSNGVVYVPLAAPVPVIEIAAAHLHTDTSPVLAAFLSVVREKAMS